VKSFFIIPFLLSVFLLSAGCGKQDHTISIVYTVKLTAGAPGKFSVSYSADGGITKTEGSLSNDNWSSATYKKMPGDYVSFKIQCLASQSSYIARIYKNGDLYGETPVDFASGQVELNGVLQE
jgi:hypothetical protein